MSMNDNIRNGLALNYEESGISAEWLVQQYNNQQEINVQLLQSLAAIQAALRTPSVLSEPSALALGAHRSALIVSQKPKHSLPHLSKFDGQDCSAYLVFKGYLRVKYRVDLDAIRGETEKVWYSYRYLIGKAAERIFLQLAATEERQIPLWVKDFFTQLDTVFSDPQSAQRALEWINTKKQGN